MSQSSNYFSAFSLIFLLSLFTFYGRILRDFLAEISVFFHTLRVTTDTGGTLELLLGTVGSQ
jgi:hypothetical protein